MALKSLSQIGAQLASESEAAYRASPHSQLTTDFFGRCGRDAAVRPGPDQTEITPAWCIATQEGASDLARRMAVHLAEFLHRGLGLQVGVEVRPAGRLEGPAAAQCVLLSEQGGGDPEVPESFTVSATAESVVLRGRDAAGLRDAVAHLARVLGLRRAPIVAHGTQVHRPRLSVRLGNVPYLGSYRDLVFLGYNAVFAGGGDLYAFSRSDAIAELAERRQPLPSQPSGAAAREYGLRTFAFLNTRQKFPADHAVFRAHPELRGAKTWSADGEHVLCTEHPLVRRFLMESVEGLYRADPDLDGIVVIIGGEGFYHCFMRPYGVEKGHTNCPRCEALGAETVVANLVNALGEAARRVNPRAEAVAWPYSAEHVWSADAAQSGFIKRLKAGTGIFTEIEKDEFVEKGQGVRKHLWDYSIDLIGPGLRAQQQVAACRAAGIPIYLKSEPELAFESSRLPHVPCMDRWVARAEALARCGADGAWVFPAFRPLYGTSASEINGLFWWDPVPPAEEVLQALAARLAGKAGGPHLRRAWELVSQAIEHSPELPPYYTGPTYTGPAHPMCVDAAAELPEVFRGLYLFMAEAQDSEGLKSRPTYFTEPRGDRPVFEGMYRRMADLLCQAAAAVERAAALVPPERAAVFAAEASSVRWFHHSIRTTANFYASCRLRDAVRSGAGTAALFAEWRQVLADELANARAAVPVAASDVRLDFYYGSDHTFPHLVEMLAAKIGLLEHELSDVLPALAGTAPP